MVTGQSWVDAPLFVTVVAHSACLPKDACYTAQLSLAELYGYDDEIEASQQVVAEVSACTYLLYQGVEEYSFCLDAAGACDYCHGAFEMNVAWEGSISNNKKSQSFWLVYDVDAGTYRCDVSSAPQT